jgi:hypothetical protein
MKQTKYVADNQYLSQDRRRGGVDLFKSKFLGRKLPLLAVLAALWLGITLIMSHAPAQAQIESRESVLLTDASLNTPHTWHPTDSMPYVP